MGSHHGVGGSGVFRGARIVTPSEVLDVSFADSATRGFDLLQLASEGDSDALVTLYRAHFAEVRSLAERLLGCRPTADDVAHTVFEALPRALRRYRGDGSVRAFLLAMTVRTARTYVRAARRRRAAEARGANCDNVSGPEEASAHMERKQLARLLSEALDRLSHQQRAAFVLCEVEERTSEEAGRILGESPTTVRARVFQAKRKLRRVLPQLESTARGRAQ